MTLELLQTRKAWEGQGRDPRASKEDTPSSLGKPGQGWPAGNWSRCSQPESPSSSSLYTTSGLALSRGNQQMSLTQFVPLHPFPVSTPFLPSDQDVLSLGLAEVCPAARSLLVNLFNPAPWSQADQPASLSGGQCFYNLFS